MTAPETFDVVVIGAGPPGENAAQYAIQGSGRTAALVEAELVGGECSYWACMPSKTLLRAGEVLDLARNVPGVAGLVGEGPVDVAAVLARRDRVVNHLDDASQVAWATGAGIEVIRGRGELTGEKSVRVTGSDGSVRDLLAREAVVLATGTTAAIPPVPGLAQALPWTSRDVTNLHEVPGRVAIIGGGVVACEAATWLSSFGAQVTVIGSAPRLLARNEPFAGEAVQERLTAAGASVQVGATVDSVSRPDPRDTGIGRIHGGEVTVGFATADGPRTVAADEVLVAAGRTPASAELGLGTVGVSTDRGFVRVDDHLTVPGVPWLYVVGDLNGRALLTHMGKYQARIAGAVIAARAEGLPVDGLWFTDSADGSAVPQVTFTDPQVGSVGMSLAEAERAGIDAVAVDHDLAALAGTYVARENYTGRARLVIDRSAGTIVGATFVGPEIADLVHAATIAVAARVPLTTLWHAVPSYPTPSEVWLRLLEAYFNPTG